MKNYNFIYFSNSLVFKKKRNKILSFRNLILFLFILLILFYFSSKSKRKNSKEKKSNFTQTKKINNNKKENKCYPINTYMNLTQCFPFIFPNELSINFKINNKNITIENPIKKFLKNSQIEINERKCFSEKLMYKINDLNNLKCIEIEQNENDKIPYSINFSLYKIIKEIVHLYSFKEINISKKIQNDDILIYDNKIRFCNFSQSNSYNMDSLLEIKWNVTKQKYFCLNNLYFIY